MLQANTLSYSVTTKTVPTFYFIGVTTTKSSIMNVFPLWMKELDRLDVVIEGIDHPMHDTPENYRRSVAQIKYDPLSLGALVTTHKVNLFEASRDLFDFLDPYAQICGEVSSISKLEGRLEGHAKDPITAGLSMDAIIKSGYFHRTGGWVLCFGAGGSAAATALHLIQKKDRGDRPKKFVTVNRSQPRLEGMRKMVAGQATDIEFEWICNQDPRVNDQIMERMPKGSIVINATGMGKDSPGSPITWDGKFPHKGIAWEFNYRGELDFLHQAEAQVESRGLNVEDGWVYFVHGWTQVVSQVLHIDLTPDLFNRMESLAASVRK
jgi:shikimate 5-dehydrogenase